ncbi:MAG: acyl-CoA dehydrogenase, partial [Rhodoferax sp.]|nr:acyl-CoA dehydrogenase [Rhodoferax sp.]
EWLCAANHGWTMAPGLLHGAYECLKHHGSEELKAAYLSKIATGEWLATMCLTEPHAGSDLGLARTRATPQADGSYRLNGTKIFISGGEHDLSDNIVHLVLARLPDAPPGPRGLSLFLVPKFYPDGQRSRALCDRIEEKMGLHGSPTCVMRFDDATGWLVGEPGRGLGAMFVMMNAARLHVALQGIGLLDAAWQKADAYARERRQMRAPVRRDPAAAADPLIEHPAIQRILDTQRAWVDGGRVLAYRTAVELDRIAHASTPDAQAASQRWCALVTPVMKAAFTHQAFHGGSDCLQVLGGHGYVREWGIEQIVRDARVAMIYEGTNEIQAIDLLVRKVLTDQGTGLIALLDELESDPRGQPADSQAPAPTAARTRLAALRTATRQVVQAAARDAALPYRVADDYLRACALVLLEWAWRRIDAGLADPTERWQAPSRALRQWILPEFDMRCAILGAHCQAVARPARSA